MRLNCGRFIFVGYGELLKVFVCLELCFMKITLLVECVRGESGERLEVKRLGRKLFRLVVVERDKMGEILGREKYCSKI